jgi:hypothetical protein
MEVPYAIAFKSFFLVHCCHNTKDLHVQLSQYETYAYHYLLNYLLTPWSRVLLEKLTGFAASQEIPRIYGT